MWFGGEDAAEAGKKDNIVEISPFLTDRSFPEIAEVDAYWQALRGDRLMPTRAEVDPRGIKGALPNCFILERIAPGIGRIRLAGQRLDDLMGMEVRGTPFTTLFTPQYRKMIEELSEEVCAAPGVAQLALSAERGLRKPAIEARMTLWPLADDRGRPTRILGGLSFKGDVGRSPRRFQVASSRVKLLASATSATRQRQTAGFAEAPAPFAAKPAEPPSRNDHLRLVKPD